MSIIQAKNASIAAQVGGGHARHVAPVAAGASAPAVGRAGMVSFRCSNYRRSADGVVRYKMEWDSAELCGVDTEGCHAKGGAWVRFSRARPAMETARSRVPPEIARGLVSLPTGGLFELFSGEKDETHRNRMAVFHQFGAALALQTVRSSSCRDAFIQMIRAVQSSDLL